MAPSAIDSVRGISSLTHGTNGDVIPVTCKMLRRLKTTLDKVTPSNSDLIYSLSDLALLLVNDQAGAKGWDTNKFPGHIVYPTQLYKTTAFMASGPPVKEGAQPGLGDYSHLPRGYVIVRSVPITSTSNAANKTKAAQKRSRSKASTSSAKTKGGKQMKQTKLSFAAGTRSMPERDARRHAIIDVGDRDIEKEFDDYESEEEYDEIDNNTALVVVSSPPASPGPLSENTTASTPARKRKSAKPASVGAATDQAAEVGVDPDEKRSRRRRR